MKNSILPDMAVEASKAAPPVGVGSLLVAGVSMSDWVLILTAIYTLLQIGLLVRDKIIRPRRERR